MMKFQKKNLRTKFMFKNKEYHFEQVNFFFLNLTIDF